ncbi:MAG TPA: ribosome small subunit-dependent GTPase A [Gammaproteobacteria bacterium]|nr:ribosome small subunit-dependent GTPase A [Gammaproteobacteria bacterium]
MTADKSSLTGLVITQHGATAIVEDSEGQLYQCKIRRSLGRLVCGDRVQFQIENNDNGIITTLEKRSSVLERPLNNGQSRLVAANITRIVVVMAVQPPFSEALIDRYLVIAELMRIQPVIVLNKTDLLNEQSRAATLKQFACYEHAGYSVLETSVEKEHGLSTLNEQLQSHTSILVGQSGVGKSSLVKALLPDIEIKIGALKNTLHGRHTTSTSVLYRLPNGGELIDSPGVRDFGVWHLEANQLARGYREFGKWLDQCRFNNCSHTHEPGCAVHAAADQGDIDPARYQRYLAMYAELSAL